MFKIYNKYTYMFLIFGIVLKLLSQIHRVRSISLVRRKLYTFIDIDGCVDTSVYKLSELRLVILKLK